MKGFIYISSYLYKAIMKNFDVEAHLGRVTRTVSALERDGEPARVVTLNRSYDTQIDDLWDALTNPERLPRWFAPVEGDLRLGGRYQVKGNAGGTITACEAPRSFDLTWEFGGGTSWVELRLEAESVQKTRLTLRHIAPVNEHWKKFGPGATGVGWDLTLLGLQWHLDDPAFKTDEQAFYALPEAKTFVLGSSEAWGAADVAGGEAAAQAEAAAKRTGAFYTGNPVPED